MKRVFLDTNTLLSGIVFSGPEHELLKKGVKRGFELVTSEDVIGELVEVINRKFPQKSFLVKEFLQLAEIKIVRRKSYARLIEKQTARDPNDRHVLAAASAAGCSVIVSGDKDLLSLNSYKGMLIKTTREMLRK